MLTEEATTTEPSQTVITDFTGSPTMITDGTTCMYSTSGQAVNDLTERRIVRCRAYILPIVNDVPIDVSANAQ